jgi:hypothetical protein
MWLCNPLRSPLDSPGVCKVKVFEREAFIRSVYLFFAAMTVRVSSVSQKDARLNLTRGNDDDDEQDDDADNEAHAHLHVLPPHLLAHTICASSEALSGGGKVVSLVL